MIRTIIASIITVSITLLIALTFFCSLSLTRASWCHHHCHCCYHLSLSISSFLISIIPLSQISQSFFTYQTSKDSVVICASYRITISLQNIRICWVFLHIAKYLPWRTSSFRCPFDALISPAEALGNPYGHAQGL